MRTLTPIRLLSVSAAMLVASTAAAQPETAAPQPEAPAASSPVVRQITAPAPARQPEPASTDARGIGDVTRLLFAAQADGRRAGGNLPMLGEAATRSWQRYMESFSQPIPEWFDERVEDN